MKITANADGKEVTVEFDLGKDLDDAAKKYGKDVVFSKWVAAEKITIQGKVRGLIRQGKSPKEIQEAVDKHKPGEVPARGKSRYEKLLAAYNKMSEEERKQFIADLKAGKL